MSDGLHAIVLAAGSARRFGGPKLSAPWRGTTVLGAAIRSAVEAPVESVLVVAGAWPDAARAAAAVASVRCLHARDYAKGMSASIRAGVRALPRDARGVFLFLGDMPATPPGLPQTMAHRLAGDVLAVAPTWEGMRGHPVLFARELFPDLLALTGDRGARALLDRLGDRLALVEAADSGIVFDVDQPSDLETQV